MPQVTYRFRKPSLTMKTTIGLILASLLAAGCTDGSPKPPSGDAPTTAPPGPGQYSVKFYVDRGNGRVLKQALPMDRGAPSREEAPEGEDDVDSIGPDIQEQSTTRGGENLGTIREAATIEEGDDTPVDTVREDEKNDYVPGSTLLKYAIQSCWDSSETGAAHELTLGTSIQVPWSNPYFPGSTWYAFAYYAFAMPGLSQLPQFATCDHQLYAQEVLLCAADRLAQIGDSPGTVTWNGVDEELDGDEMVGTPITVTIPPQSTTDKFIARDMAMNVLAHLAALDLREQPVMVANFGTGDILDRRTCDEWYRNMADDGTIQVSLAPFSSHWAGRLNNAGRAFNAVTPKTTFYFDNVTIDSVAKSQAAGRTRVDRRAMILSSAARLLRDLVARNIEDDRAGAERVKATAADPAKGLKLYWDGESDNPYNSMRHGLRTLLGRLEIGDEDGSFNWDPEEQAQDDPRCTRDAADGHLVTAAGRTALQTADALGNWYTARYGDVPPTTTAQSQLIGQLDRSGIVIPPASLLDFAAVRENVLKELLLQAAVRAQNDPDVDREDIDVDDFVSDTKTKDIASAIKAEFEKVGDDDLRFALRRISAAYQLAFAGQPITSGSASANGGNVADYSPLSAVNGFVLQGGVPRQEIAGDVTARLTKAQQSSQCGYDGGSSATDSYKNPGYAAVFQSAFSLGEVYTRRLGSLVKDAEAIGVDATTRFANAAFTEARQWSGGRVIRSGTGSTVDYVDLIGFTAEDFGAPSLADLGEELVLTLPFPNMADCIAGTRSTCTDQGTLDLISAHATDVDEFEPSEADGLVTPILQLRFTHDSWGMRQEAAYLILPSGTKFNGGKGLVLATLGATYSTSHGDGEDIDYQTSEVVSPVQRQLVNSLFGIQQAERPQRTCGNEASAALPSDYCIPGMQRDMFVPLANEVTSAGTNTEDSWKHYLAVAKEAAQKADTIAKEMIDLGLSRDIRQEAATAQVGEICGAFPQVDGFSSSGGKLDLSDEDGAINQCLNEASVDLVYFRADPFAGLSDTEASLKIWDTYCVAENLLPPPFCKSKTRGSLITHGGLNLISKLPEPPPYNADDPYADCSTFATSWNPTEHTLDRQLFDQYATRSWAYGAGGFVNALSQAKFVVDPDANWALTLAGTVVMGSRPKVSQLVGGNASLIASVWPACGDPSSAGCNLKGKAVAKLFVPPASYSVTSTYPSVEAQVESALFYVGALAGGIPTGVFNLPVLAANRATLDEPVAAPAMFAHGVFHEETDHSYRLISTGYAGTVPWTQDIIASGGLYWRQLPVNSTFGADRAAGRVLPLWLESLYGQVDDEPTNFLTMNVENVPFAFRTELPMGKASGKTTSTRDDLSFFIHDLATLAEDSSASEEKTELYDLVMGATRTDNPRYWSTNKSQTDPPGVRQICAGAPAGPVFVTQNLPPEGDPGLFVTDILTNSPSIRPPSAAGWGDRRVTTAAGSKDKACQGGAGAIGPGCGVFVFDTAQAADCTATDGEWWQVSSGDCAQYPWSADGGGWGMSCQEGHGGPVCSGPATHRIAHERLSPTLCPPADRLELYLNRRVESNGDAMTAVHRAMGLSCLAQMAPGQVIPSLPPVVDSEAKLTVLQSWVGQYARIMDAATSLAYVTNVPRSVLAAAGTVNQAAVTQGEQGKLLLEVGKNLNSIEGRLADIAGSFRRLENAIWTARNAIKSANTDAELQSLQTNYTELELGRQIALEEAAQSQALISGLFGAVLGGASGATGFTNAGGIFTSGPNGGIAQVGLGSIFKVGSTVVTPWFGATIGAASAVTDAVAQAHNAGTSLDSMRAQQNNLRQQHQAIKDGVANRVEGALIALNESSDGAYQLMEDSVRGVEDSQATILQNLATYLQNRNKGTFALAQASGADFFETNGQLVPMRVNTVYRRQFDVLKQRYDRALTSAKRAAYLARLAIEERLGTRLDDLDASLGPLEAPSLWVDDLCSLQGVDYEALRTATDPTTTTPGGDEKEIDLVKGFADQYVGDYVDRLSEFVEFYNLENPFREGDDETVLSLREDLGNSQVRCQRQAHNLFYWSEDMLAHGPQPNEAEADDWMSLGGWLATACSAQACLEVSPASRLTTGSSALLAPPGGSATWIHSRARVPAVDVSTESGPAPSNVLYQSVPLRAGQRYVLSWWDIARNASGDKPSASTSVNYVVSVYDKAWRVVDSIRLSAASTSTPAWSERRTLSFVAPSDENYQIVFSPDSANSLTFSLALAGAQLEEDTSGSGGAGAYEPTRSTRFIESGSCPVDSPDAFRSRFDYRCAEGRCYYELKDPLVIDTEVLSQRFSSLIGKVAPGNYNYRLSSVALNIVGTGVSDCARSHRDSCYGEGYLEYDLHHQAFSVPIEDQKKQVRCFDFGVGHVYGGKALAIERFLTTPLGSADKSLVEQPSITKLELGGRPLSGAYRLRIYDNPALAWGNLEDVQILVNYRYWSAVDRSTSR